MKEDPRELVKEHDENVLACPKTEKPVDLDLLGKQFAELFSFVREKVYDAQSKFDRTIIYLSGGAIALTYQLLLSDKSDGKCTLLLAIGVWALACVFTLAACMWRIGHETRVLNSIGRFVNVIDDYKFWKDNLREFDKLVKLAEHGFVGIGEQPSKTPSKAKAEFKKCIEKIHREHAEESKKSQKAIEDLRTSYTSEWPINLVQFALFVCGCLIFGRYTYGNVKGVEGSICAQGGTIKVEMHSNVVNAVNHVVLSNKEVHAGGTNSTSWILKSK